MSYDDIDLDDRRFAPSVVRNREPILDFLKVVLTEPGSVLEVGCGTGEHGAWFAPGLPHLTWQPTEFDADMHKSIAAWAADAGADNILPPQALDVLNKNWPPAENLDDLVAIFSSCVVHITPWTVTEALFRGAAKYLPIGGSLILYGPFIIDGEPTAPSNTDFDSWLRSKDPSWGIRNLNDVTQLSEDCGLARETVGQMPVNNLSLVFRRI